MKIILISTWKLQCFSTFLKIREQLTSEVVGEKFSDNLKSLAAHARVHLNFIALFGCNLLVHGVPTYKLLSLFAASQHIYPHTYSHEISRDIKRARKHSRKSKKENPIPAATVKFYRIRKHERHQRQSELTVLGDREFRRVVNPRSRHNR